MSKRTVHVDPQGPRVIVDGNIYRPADKYLDGLDIAAYKLVTSTKYKVGARVNVKRLGGIPVAVVGGERWYSSRRG